MRALRFWRFGLGAAVALSIGVASAAGGPTDYPQCTKKASPSDLDAAKQTHKAASEWYDRGDYDKAIQYWRDAYTLDCSAHAVLINIANAYEKKGDKASAVVALETYQARTGGTNEKIAEKINRLKEAIAAAPPTPTPEATTAPSTSPTSAPTTAPTAPAGGDRPYGVAPWVVVGSGGALLVVGAILLPVGYGAVSSAQANCPTFQHCS